MMTKSLLVQRKERLRKAPRSHRAPRFAHTDAHTLKEDRGEREAREARERRERGERGEERKRREEEM